MWQIDCELHIVGGSLVGHEPRHVFLEEGLSEHHEMGEHRLVGGAIAEALVAREHVVYEGGARTPVAEDEHGIVLHRYVGQELAVAAILNGSEHGEQSAHGFGQAVLALPRAVYFTSGGEFFERFPIGSYERINGEFVEFDKTHLNVCFESGGGPRLVIVARAQSLRYVVFSFSCEKGEYASKLINLLNS